MNGLPLVPCLLGLLVASHADHRSVSPVPRKDPGILERQAETLRRARESRPCDVVFLGDSITQSWEGPGAEVWKERIAPLGAVNLGVSGDRTEHVLWRLAEAPLTRLDPKVVVVLLGTNNLGHGTASAEQTFDGLAKVVETLRGQVPSATIAVCGIFPRGERFSSVRGDLLEVNQAITARFAGDSRVRVLDFGVRFLAPDGSIPARLMPDSLHLSPEGYAIWADAIGPVLPGRTAP